MHGDPMARLAASPRPRPRLWGVRAGEGFCRLRAHGRPCAGIVEYIKSRGKPLLFEDAKASKGSFLLDTGIAARLRDFRRFCTAGAVPEIAGALLDSEQVKFFGDQIFVKEPQTRERTAFHQ